MIAFVSRTISLALFTRTVTHRTIRGLSSAANWQDQSDTALLRSFVGDCRLVYARTISVGLLHCSVLQLKAMLLII